MLLFIKHKWLMWSTLGLALVALVVLMDTTKTGLVPDEDQGTIMVNVTAAPGSGLAETHLIMEQVADRIEDIPQIRDFMQVAGYGMIAGQGSSYGMCIIKLKDWAERPEKSDAVQAVIGQIYARTADIKDAQIFAVAPPMISGYGTSTGFSTPRKPNAPACRRAQYSRRWRVTTAGSTFRTSTASRRCTT